MSRFKTVHVPRGYDGLHIELPGCIINIEIGLHDRHLREVTRVSIDAAGDRYAGEPPWWAHCDKPSRMGVGVRIIREYSHVQSPPSTA